MRVHRFEDVVRRRFRPQEIAEIEAEAHAELERYERGELPDDSVTDDE